MNMDAVPQSPALKWRKASRSTGNGACVEVASFNRIVAVRDSQDASGPVISCTQPDWRKFLSRVGEPSDQRLNPVLSALPGSDFRAVEILV